MLLAASILSALLYFIVLRIRGRCTNCIPLEDELHKWKTGQLKPITREMVDARMRKRDEENAVEGTGAMDVQAALYREQMRMQSLATLEGRDEQGSVKGSLGGSEKTIAVEYDDDAKTIASSFLSSASSSQSSLKDLRPVVEETGRELTDDGTATPKHDSFPFPKTYSGYLENVIAPREAEAARLRREGQDQLIERNLDIASDPSKRASVQEKAMARANKYMLERVEEEKEEKEEKENENKKETQIARPMPAARADGQSRFKERFSLASQRGSVSKYPGM